MSTRARGRGSRVLVLSLLCLFVVTSSSPPRAADAQETRSEQPYRISYRISMPRPESHLFELRIDVEGLPPTTRHVDFQMPRWSPGRYAVFEFARNVQEVQAANYCAPETKCERAQFAPRRLDTQTWRVETQGAPGTTLSYKVFADDLSGTFSQLDARHANFNGASVFMYVVGHKQDPATLEINAPEGWKIANGYAPRADGRTWEFPNYDILIDTPTEIAPDWTVEEFQVDGRTYRVVVHAFGADGGKRRSLARDVEKIVRAETAMMGAPDLSAYTFIFHFDPSTPRGDGMEHLTSTQIIVTSALAAEGAYEDALETAAHEFFHVWNVKRLRPAELGPWDFTRPLATRSLWIAEGLTNYYGLLMLRRAGLWTEEQLLDALGRTITTVENSPGNRLISAEEASVIAPFLDRASSDQRTNLANTTISYYPKGETLGFVLDLLVRARSQGRASLDDVMRRMYEEFYVKAERESYYLKGRGYTSEDFERVAAAVAGANLSDFFARSVRGVEQPPYEQALAWVGLRFVRALERDPHTAGLQMDARDAQNARVTGVRTGSAAERAGIRHGDVLVQIGGRDVTTGTWRGALNTFRQGARVPFTLRRGRETVSTFVTLEAPDRYDYRIERDPQASPEARARRAAWLDGTR
ncbi:MAG TPA: PDZ domain-containing protein [Pyrinomonadaceae bacterium]|nr:PDZ domain-containing protein [Pyrinomonadaceae bacterium]